MNEETMKLVVSSREEQGEGIVVLELMDREARPLPAFEPGAHLDLHLAPGVVRQYSLCGDPADRSHYRLGVLRDSASRGGSVAVHESLQIGAEVSVGAPRNQFPLSPSASRSILLGGGIGVTPMLSMAHALHAADAEFELHYFGRSRRRMAFLDELPLAPYAARVQVHCDDEVGGGLDLAAVLKRGQGDAHVYVCGPAGFMAWAIAEAERLGYSPERIHREYFQIEVDGSGDAFEVVAAASNKRVRVEAGQTIVTALATVGIEVEVSCEQGICGTCLCTVLEGQPDHRDVYLTEEERADNDQILLCCSRSRSTILVLDI